MKHKSITLSADQVTLLGHLKAAVAATPEVHPFHCVRLRRIGFTWILHDEFFSDVRVAHWDDVLALESFGLLELQIGEDDPDDCLFVLNDLALKIPEQPETASSTCNYVTYWLDADASDAD